MEFNENGRGITTSQIIERVVPDRKLGRNKNDNTRMDNKKLLKYRQLNRVEIYIGSDNSSRKICENYLKKVKNWADATFPEGYTLLKGEGCYRGIYEDSVIINVISDDGVDLRNQLEELKRELNQESILVVKSAITLNVV